MSFQIAEFHFAEFQFAESRITEIRIAKPLRHNKCNIHFKECTIQEARRYVSADRYNVGLVADFYNNVGL